MRKTKRKIKTSFIVSVLVVLIILASSLCLALQKPKVSFTDPLRFPVGAKITRSDLVREVQGGTLVDPDVEVDSSKEGTVKCILTLKNLFNVESEEEILIQFYRDDSEKKKPIKEEPKTEDEKKTEDPDETKTQEQTGSDEKQNENKKDIPQRISRILL